MMSTNELMLKIMIFIKEDMKAGGRWLEDVGKIGGMEGVADVLKYITYLCETLKR